MHNIEPYFRWRNFYVASEDSRSPFFNREYSEFEYTNAIYDHLIHPQWDDIGSQTLFIKVIYADYNEGHAIIEMIGEWNDLLYNDIMILKRDYLEPMMAEGLNKFILIGENVLNFHASDDCYYEEWFDEVTDQGGWISLVCFRNHVLREMYSANIDQYLVSGGKLDEIDWRTYTPERFCAKIEKYVTKRIGA